MSLADIAELLATKMASMAPPVVPPYDFGANKLAVDRPGPRIIYVPRGERLTPAGQGGDGVGEPRSLFMRHVTIAAHIWANDVTQAEKLVSLMVQALHELMFGAYRISGGQWATAVEWVTQFDDPATVPPSPVIYTLNMEWDIPLTRKADTYAAVLSTLPLDPLIASAS